MDKERKNLWAAIRKFPFSSEYGKIKNLNAALLKAIERPPTPPAYVPVGWTVEQARRFDFNLIAKLSEEVCFDSCRLVQNHRFNMIIGEIGTSTLGCWKDSRRCPKSSEAGSTT